MEKTSSKQPLRMVSIKKKPYFKSLNIIISHLILIM